MVYDILISLIKSRIRYLVHCIVWTHPGIFLYLSAVHLVCRYRVTINALNYIHTDNKTLPYNIRMLFYLIFDTLFHVIEIWYLIVCGRWFVEWLTSLFSLDKWTLVHIPVIRRYWPQQCFSIFAYQLGILKPHFFSSSINTNTHTPWVKNVSQNFCP